MVAVLQDFTTLSLPAADDLLKNIVIPPCPEFLNQLRAEMAQDDHAHIGAIMAHAWGLGDTLCTAIKRHHDYGVFQDPNVPDEVSWLVAVGLVVELAIQRYSYMNASCEWEKGGDQTMGVLMLSEQELEDWVEDLIADFAMDE